MQSARHYARDLKRCVKVQDMGCGMWVFMCTISRAATTNAPSCPRPELFGDTVVIERVLEKSGGGSYTLKNENGSHSKKSCGRQLERWAVHLAEDIAPSRTPSMSHEHGRTDAQAHTLPHHAVLHTPNARAHPRLTACVSARRRRSRTSATTSTSKSTTPALCSRKRPRRQYIQWHLLVELLGEEGLGGWGGEEGGEWW